MVALAVALAVAVAMAMAVAVAIPGRPVAENNGVKVGRGGGDYALIGGKRRAR